ncbi:MAG: hypothetical protein LBH28_01865 [Oscillospiraceae bacterium]|jgi:hypothetical protein|nr:hypothetical protein [Oscillospiraceae bacterium]
MIVKNHIKKVIALALCFFMLVPLTAQASPLGNDDITWKVTGKYIYKAPYKLYVSGRETKTEDFGGIPYVTSWELKLDGNYYFDGLVGDWDFNFEMDYSMRIHGSYENIAFLNSDIVAHYSASGKGEIREPANAEKPTGKRICKDWKPRRMVDGKVTEVDPWTGEPVKKEKKNAYEADFNLDGKALLEQGYISVSVPDGTVNEDLKKNVTEMDATIGVKLTMNQAKDRGITPTSQYLEPITIPGSFEVKAVFTLDGQTYEGNGLLECTQGFESTTKGTAKIPIWGTWNERNPYDEMPNLSKDYASVQESIEAGDKPKSIDYVKGNWLMLKEGKGGKGADNPFDIDPNTYMILSVGEKDIYYEEGELWVDFGYFALHPTVCGIYSLDLKSKEDCYPWEDKLEVEYNKNDDTLSTSIYDHAMYRVRPMEIAGVWATVKTTADEEDDSYARILNGKYDVPGVWYAFTRGSGEPEDGEDIVVLKHNGAYYNAERTTVNSNGSARIDTGFAMIETFFGDYQIKFFEIETQELNTDGSIKATYKSKDEALAIANFNSDSGSMDIAMRTYYKLGKASIKSCFSSDKAVNAIPDLTDEIEEAAPEDIAKALALSAGTHIFSFDSDESTFVWIQRTTSGVLVQTGEYSTVGDALLILNKIVGGYRPDSGDDSEAFSGINYSGGEKVFQFIPTKNADGDLISIKVAGLGELYSFKPNDN